MRRWLKIILGLLIILLLLGAGGSYYLAYRSLPDYQGQIPGAVGADVTIYRDELGIPHISAASLDDLFYAQGYTQAQDRLWQMDLSRRAVAGRLSEIFGEDFVETDFFLRSLLMRYSAEQTRPALDPRTKEHLERFAQGVNDFIEDNSSHLPPEFLLLGYKPEKWTIVDTIGIGKYMAWDLGGNMNTELLLAALLEALPEEKALELFPVYPEEALTIVTKKDFQGPSPGGHAAAGYLDLLKLSQSLRPGIPGQELGSNNWVVDGSMTSSGKPLLANDMHLGMGLPSIWYQTRLEIPGELTLSGVIFPGVPGIIVGTNGHVAWGVTNVGPDVQDLYRERQHPENPHLFEYDGEWEEALVLEENIYVKGREEPLQKEILITRNGPIISHALMALDEAEEVPGVSEPLSLRWTAHDVTREMDAVLGFMTARSWTEFAAALENFHVPAQNFVFADLEGNIAYRANGRIPIRKKGEGLLPAPGWDPDYQWQGFIPYGELPALYNPQEGFIITANHRVVSESYPYHISHQWAPPYRAQAILEDLEGREGLTVRDMMDTQFNVVNTQARLLMPLIGEDLSEASWQGTEADALEILLRWGEDPKDEVDSPGAALYHTLYVKALEVTFQEEMGEELFELLARGPVVSPFDRMLLEGSLWFDDYPGGRSAMLQEAFRRAVADLEERLKGTPETWEWGKLHQILLSHNLSQVPLLGRLFVDGPYPLAGSHLTPAAASYRLADPFMVRSSAPWRYVADLADLSGNSWENLAGGVSGHPLSPHFKDQTRAWLEGDYTPVPLGMPAGEETGGRFMKILPGE